MWLRGSAWLVAGSMVSMPLTALSFVIIARLLGPSDLGRYALVVAATTFLTAVTSFRLETHLLVTLGEAGPGEATRSECEVAVRAGLLLSIPTIVLILILIVMFPVLGLPWWVFALASLEILFSPALFARSVLQARGLQSAIAIASTLNRLIWVAWILGLMVTDQVSIPAIIGGRVVALCVEGVILGKAARIIMIPRWPSTLRNEFAALKKSAPLAIAGIAGSSYARLDQFLLAGLVSTRAVGLYAGGVRLAELVRVVPAVVQNVITPALVMLSEKGKDDQLRRAFRDGTLMMLVPAGFLAALLTGSAEGLIELTLGGAYAAATNALIVLAVAEIPIALLSAAGQTALALGNRRLLASGALLGLIVNLALNLVLIPPLGIVGAAVASMVAYAVVAARYLLSRSLRQLGVGDIVTFMFRVLLCVAAAASIGRSFDNLVLSLSLTGGVYLLASGLAFPRDSVRIASFVLGRRVSHRD